MSRTNPARSGPQGASRSAPPPRSSRLRGRRGRPARRRQVAPIWLTSRPGVTAPIIAARTLKHLEDNLASADLKLDAAATRRLDDVSAPRLDDYPYGPFGEKQRSRYVDSSEQGDRRAVLSSSDR